jgi:hypothetical protein
VILVSYPFDLQDLACRRVNIDFLLPCLASNLDLEGINHTVRSLPRARLP